MGNAETVAAVGSLADPTRRLLYDYISDRRGPVSREEAAEALGLSPAKAKFHLDRLAEEGLLDTEFRRLSGRRGPGAGRPAKLYRRSEAELSVSLPERRYDLVGGILATAIERAESGEDLGSAIGGAAYASGIEAAGSGVGSGSEARSGLPAEPDGVARPGADADAMRRAGAVLDGLGYETRFEGGELRLRNCPFDSLAQRHRELVCASNERFVQGVLDGTGCDCLRARLDPCPGYCCVAVRGDDDPGAGHRETDAQSSETARSGDA